MNDLDSAPAQLTSKLDKLHRSAEQYRRLLDEMGDGYVITCEGQIVFTNRRMAEMLDCSADDLIGRLWKDFVEPEIADHIERTPIADLAPLIEAQLIHPRGEELIVELAVRSSTFDGQLAEFTLVRDITQRVRVERELRQYRQHLEKLVQERTAELTTTNEHLQREINERIRVEEMLRQRNSELDAFAHTVAHDLIGQLAPLLGFVQLLETDHAAALDSDGQICLNKIRKIGFKMSNIIDELLLLAQLRATQVPIEPLNMATVVQEALQRLVYMIQEHKAEVIVPPKEAWPVALGYSSWIEEVWINYLSNGLKYGGRPEQGLAPRLELGATIETASNEKAPRVRTSMVRFWVKDNGPGIAPAEQAQLFTPFNQIQIRARGHGLGLSIVRHIVEKLGGQVGVESIVGAGSTFWFTLPASEQDSAIR